MNYDASLRKEWNTRRLKLLKRCKGRDTLNFDDWVIGRQPLEFGVINFDRHIIEGEVVKIHQEGGYDYSLITGINET